MSKPRLCIICGARVTNTNPRANTCGPICTEQKRIQAGAPTVRCATCDAPALVRYGITTEVNCAGCDIALGRLHENEDALSEEKP